MIMFCIAEFISPSPLNEGSVPPVQASDQEDDHGEGMDEPAASRPLSPPTSDSPMFTPFGSGKSSNNN